MQIVVLFTQGSANFRFVPGANFVEVEGTDGLGEIVWLPAKGGHPQREALLEKALQRMTAAWSARAHGEIPDERYVRRDERGRVVIDIGKVG